MGKKVWFITELSVIEKNGLYFVSRTEGFSSDINKATNFSDFDAANLAIESLKLENCTIATVKRDYDPVSGKWFAIE